jgi:hypothetical protein
VRLEAGRLSDTLKRYAAADRRAAAKGDQRFLDVLGAAMAPETTTNARH